MRISDCAGSQGEAATDLSEVVMGLHWDPVEGRGAGAADLDAACVLFGEQGRMLDVIHPGRPHSADGSVVHTGDSRAGASPWDDERIFVFLDALPDSVSALSFVVISPGGGSLNEVRGAHCHVSDHASERQWMRLDLATLDSRAAHCVASLHRGPTGWRLSADAHAMPPGLLAELSRLVARGKVGEP